MAHCVVTASLFRPVIAYQVHIGDSVGFHSAPENAPESTPQSTPQSTPEFRTITIWTTTTL